MTKKPLPTDPAPERGVFLINAAGRLVKAHRTQLKPGWRVATADEIAACVAEAKRKDEAKAEPEVESKPEPAKKGR